MKNFLLWSFLFLIFFLVAYILVVKPLNADSILLDACYQQLDESNKLIEDLFTENQNLKQKIEDLKDEITVLKQSNDSELLKESLERLEASNQMIKDLQSQNEALRVVKNEYKEELRKWKKMWSTGGGVSYPFGIEITQQCLFSRFGLYSSIGYLKVPYIKFGFLWRY